MTGGIIIFNYFVMPTPNNASIFYDNGSKRSPIMLFYTHRCLFNGNLHKIIHNRSLAILN